MIQELVARSLGIRVGDYHHFATSLHLYENDQDSVADYLGEGFQNPVFAMPRMPSGCQMENLAAFLEVERGIRQGEIADARQISLAPYWRDLSLVLLRCADSRYKRGTKVREDNFAQIGDPFYSNFFVKRPQVLPKSEAKTIVQGKFNLGEEKSNAN